MEMHVIRQPFTSMSFGGDPGASGTAALWLRPSAQTTAVFEYIERTEGPERHGKTIAQQNGDQLEMSTVLGVSFDQLRTSRGCGTASSPHMHDETIRVAPRVSARRES